MSTNYRQDDYYFHENEYHKQVDAFRFGKLLSHYEIYKKTIGIPGDIVECGIFRGKSFFQMAGFRDVVENPYSRKLIGFDIFGMFPPTNFEEDKQILQDFIDASGGESISIDEMHTALKAKDVKNYELVKGDINQTVPQYCKDHPELRISLLHIDVDVYEPCVTILENLYERVTGGGIIMLDDYPCFPGEEKAVEDFIKGKNIQLQKLPFAHAPSFFVKPL